MSVRPSLYSSAGVRYRPLVSRLFCGGATSHALICLSVLLGYFCSFLDSQYAVACWGQEVRKLPHGSMTAISLHFFFFLAMSGLSCSIQNLLCCGTRDLVP